MTKNRTHPAACLLVACVAGLAIAQAPDATTGQSPESNHNHSHQHGHAAALHNFDIRVQSPEIANRLRVSMNQPAQIRRLEAAQRLEGRIAGASVEFDHLLGVPRFVRSTSSLMTPATNARMSAQDVVRNFVFEHGELFRIDESLIRDARMTRDSVSPNSGARTLWWTQRVGGLEVFDTQLRGSVTSDGRLISVSSKMLEAPQAGWNIAPAGIDAEEALRIAAGFAGVDITDGIPEILSASDDADRAHRFAKTDALSVAPYSRLMLFPLAADELRPAWRVVVGAADESDIYLVFVDAANGEMLFRHSLTADGSAQDATYNVYIDPVTLRPLDSPAPMPTAPPTPDGTQAADASRTLVTLSSIDSFASPEGWIPAGTTETNGNNVDAHTDQNADNAPDLPRPSDAARNFDFPINFASGPASYEDAAVVQLFYVSNWYHDLMHGMGFDETAANFQVDNFGRGGVGGDSVTAQAQDGGGTNNANFSTDPSDGGLGRMQMFIFPGPNPDRDGSFDAQVVVHELTHGLSTRLHGGLFTQEAGCMGEGWSDYFSIAMLVDTAIDPNLPIATGGWLTHDIDPGYDDNYYFGIRRYPYSTDFAINPLTFADIDPAQYGVAAPAPPRSPVSFLNPEDPLDANRVHNGGEVWCNALLQCRANLMAKHGAEAGNDLMLQLVIDGMKLSPASPSFIEARDGVLLADLAMTGGENICDLWDGFALRGWGFSASSGDGASATGLTEAFDVPTGLDIDDVMLAPTAIAPGVAANFPVEIRATCGDPLNESSAMVFTSIDGAPFAGAPISETSPGVFGVSLPTINCGQELSWYIYAETDNGDPYTLPANAPVDSFTLVAFTGVDTRVDEDFELDNGWVIGAIGDSASTGIWERVDPVGTGAQPEDDDSADGTICFITGNASPGDGAGANDIDGGDTTLTSPAFDCTGGDAFISYSRWYSNNQGAAPNADSMLIDISDDNGGSWTPVEVVTENANAWVRQTIRVADYVALTDQVRMRFVPSDFGDGSLVEAGVDEVLVDVLECIGGLAGDLNGDGAVDTADLGILIAAFGTNDMTADINGDGTVDTADLGILIAAFGSTL